MTRDEAIAKWKKIMPCSNTGPLIDGFVALGVLKLDEPPLTIERRIQDTLDHLKPTAGANDLRTLLGTRGLKIVEK